jgi:hypothetical protein
MHHWETSKLVRLSNTKYLGTTFRWKKKFMNNFITINFIMDSLVLERGLILKYSYTKALHILWSNIQRLLRDSF